MIRFLQTPGPLKKMILGGLLTIICVFMVITLVPAFGSTDFFGTGAPGQRRGRHRGGERHHHGSRCSAKPGRWCNSSFPQGGAQVAMLLPYFSSQAAQTADQPKAILAEAQRMGLRATDDDVRDELQHGRYATIFFPEGNFIGQAAYEERLQQADLTVTQFEQSVKDDILLDKLRNLVGGSALVTDAEVHEKFVKDNTKVKFDYAVLTQGRHS